MSLHIVQLYTNKRTYKYYYFLRKTLIPLLNCYTSTIILIQQHFYTNIVRQSIKLKIAIEIHQNNVLKKPFIKMYNLSITIVICNFL